MTKIGDWLSGAEATLMAFFTREEEILLDFIGPLLTQIKDVALQLGKDDLEAGLKVLKDASIAAAVSAVSAPPGLKTAAAEAAFLKIAATEGVEAIHNAEAAAIKAAVAFIQTNTPVSINVPISFLQAAQQAVVDLEHTLLPGISNTAADAVATIPPVIPVTSVANSNNAVQSVPNNAVQSSPVLVSSPAVVSQPQLAPVIAPIVPVAVTPPPAPPPAVATTQTPLVVTPPVPPIDAPLNSVPDLRWAGQAQSAPQQVTANLPIIGLPPNVTIIPTANT